MIPPQQLGYMAGVLDLKGRLLYKNNRTRATRQVVLAVETKERQVIRYLSNATGTAPEFTAARPLKDFMRRGCVEHCPEEHIHIGEDTAMPPIGRWTITGAGMVVVLHNLSPYLTVDRGYPEAVAEVLATVDLHGRGSAMVLTSLRRLEGLGWDMPPRFEHALVAQGKEQAGPNGEVPGSNPGEGTGVMLVGS